MDENKPRRRWLSFGIRDLLWAMLVVGLGIGWWLGASTPSEFEQLMQALSKRTGSKILVIDWQDDSTIEVTTGLSEGPDRDSVPSYLLWKKHGRWKVIQSREKLD